MKKKMIIILAFIMNIAAFATPTNGVEQLQNRDIRLLDDGLKETHPIRLFRLLNRLPLEMNIEVLKTLSDIDLLRLHDALSDIRAEIPARIAAEDKKFKEIFINAEDHFEGDDILASIDRIAADRIAKVLGCEVKDILSGDYQPYKDTAIEKLQADYAIAHKGNKSLSYEMAAHIKAFKPLKESAMVDIKSIFPQKKEAPCPLPLVLLLPYIKLFNKKLTSSLFWELDIIDGMRYIDAHANKFLHLEIADDTLIVGSHFSNKEVYTVYLETFPPSLQKSISQKFGLFDRIFYRYNKIIIKTEKSPIQQYNLERHELKNTLKSLGYNFYNTEHNAFFGVNALEATRYKVDEDGRRYNGYEEIP